MDVIFSFFCYLKCILGLYNRLYLLMLQCLQNNGKYIIKKKKKIACVKYFMKTFFNKMQIAYVLYFYCNEKIQI